MESSPIIAELLLRLGVTPNYHGFFQTLLAVRLASQDPNRLARVIKSLYPEVARAYGTSWKAVERNIRTIISIAWTCNRPLLEQLAQRSLPDKPTVSQFLALLAVYCSAETSSHGEAAGTKKYSLSGDKEYFWSWKSDLN